MSIDVRCLMMSHTIADALAFVDQYKVRHIPIVDSLPEDGDEPPRLVGVVSQRDLSRAMSFERGAHSEAAADAALKLSLVHGNWSQAGGLMVHHDEDGGMLKRPLKSIASMDPITVSPDTSVFAAAQKMVDASVDCMPVVRSTDAQLCVVGIMTTTDLIKVFVHMDLLRRLGDNARPPPRLIDLARTPLGDPSTTMLSGAFFGTVKDVMRHEVVTVQADDDLERAIFLMREHHIRHLPVMGDNGRLVGLLSDREILASLPWQGRGKAEKGGDFRHVLFATEAQSPHARRVLSGRVAAAMKADPTTVTPDASMVGVAERFCEGRLGAVGVLENDGELVGIVTQTDFLHSIITIGYLLEARAAAQRRDP